MALIRVGAPLNTTAIANGVTTRVALGLTHERVSIEAPDCVHRPKSSPFGRRFGPCRCVDHAGIDRSRHVRARALLTFGGGRVDDHHAGRQRNDRRLLGRLVHQCEYQCACGHHLHLGHADGWWGRWVRTRGSEHSGWRWWRSGAGVRHHSKHCSPCGLGPLGSSGMWRRCRHRDHIERRPRRNGREFRGLDDEHG